MTQKKPFFSIVIPTLNEEKYLPKLLQDLANQSFDQDKIEVIHVDGNSEDKTVEISKTFKKKLNLSVISVNKRSVSYQRNTGAKQAFGEWIIFMDADNRLPNHFLDGIKYQVIKKPNTDVFTCWMKTKTRNSLNLSIVKIINIGQELYRTIGKPAAPGAMIGCKKNVAKKVSFNEKSKLFEDSFFIQDAVSNGFIFNIFREPQYFFSLRRLKKEGRLKMAGRIAMIQLNYLQGSDFSKKNYGYSMNGGAYYDQKNPDTIHHFLRALSKASKKQLEQARRILNYFSDQ